MSRTTLPEPHLMPWGRHAGKHLSQIDEGYLKWVLRLPHNRHGVLKSLIARELAIRARQANATDTSNDEGRVFALQLKSMKSDVPVYIRLRAALKALLRTHQFRNVGLTEVQPAPPPDSPDGAGDRLAE